MGEIKTDKRGQVTIFIIIAIIIVAAMIIIFWPRLKPIFSSGTTNPQDYLQGCVQDKLQEGINLAEKRGGSIEPINSIMYKGENVEYLCYTNEYYKTCTMQQPMLKQHFEFEINEHVKSTVDSCMQNLEKDFQAKGYQVSIGSKSSSVSLTPGKVTLSIKGPVTLTKDSTSKYDNLKVDIKSNIYDFLMLSTSVLNWEARYGDSDPVSFMIYYPDLKIEKLKQSEGSKIYILTSIKTKESFTFASRSLSWPAGYGVGQIVT
jgi:hypothetical protein